MDGTRLISTGKDRQATVLDIGTVIRYQQIITVHLAYKMFSIEILSKSIPANDEKYAQREGVFNQLHLCNSLASNASS